MSALPTPAHSVPPLTPKPSPLLERQRQAARDRGDSQPTADDLVARVRAFILFHGKRHPSELGLAAATGFAAKLLRSVRIGRGVCQGSGNDLTQHRSVKQLMAPNSFLCFVTPGFRPPPRQFSRKAGLTGSRSPVQNDALPVDSHSCDPSPCRR